MLILVEQRADERNERFLRAISEACAKLGHDVIRWLHGNGKNDLPPCDMAILWNGAHWVYDLTQKRTQERKTPVLYAELGWYPHYDTFQIDPEGINFCASWVKNPPQPIKSDPPKIGAGDLLVLLQTDNDVQITGLSPQFPNMAAFVDHFSEIRGLPIRVRPHPCEAPQVRLSENMRWDGELDFTKSLASARAVACINSSGAVEAMTRGLPVLCYGKAMYRLPFAAYCMNGSKEETDIVIDELAHGKCSLYTASIKLVSDWIISHQWSFSDLPHRLVQYIPANDLPLNCGVRQVADTLGGIEQHHKERYEWAANEISPGSDVLDAGCGTGYGSFILHNRGHRVAAIDHGFEAIEFARAHYPGPRYEVRDISEAAGHYGAIVCLEAIEHIDDVPGALAKFAAALIPGGLLLVSFPNVPTAKDNYFHRKDWSEGEIRSALSSAGFEVNSSIRQKDANTTLIRATLKGKN